ncbi:MAG: hypothetical protein WC421_08865 [Elusimicrobiales bacterium]
MPTSKMRVMTVLNRADYAMLFSLSKRQQKSISQEIRESILERLAREDDRRLYAVSEKRYKSYLKTKKFVSYRSLRGKGCTK